VLLFLRKREAEEKEELPAILKVLERRGKLRRNSYLKKRKRKCVSASATSSRITEKGKKEPILSSKTLSEQATQQKLT